MSQRLDPRVAIAACLLLPPVAVGLTYLTWSILDPHTWFFFYPAMFLAAFIGTPVWAAVSVALDAVLVYALISSPRYTFELTKWSQLSLLVFFLAIGGLVIWLQERMRRSNERTREALEHAQRADNRERIARDLHETVIQQLFAIATGLRAVRAAKDVPAARARAAEVSAKVDAVIAVIRTNVFDLRHGGESHGVRAAIEELAQEAGDRVQITPELDFSGPVDTMIDDEMQKELVAVTEEALSNIVRHAHATEFGVGLMVDDAQVLLVAWDDGDGIDPPANESQGLRAMAARAQRLGGMCTFDHHDGAGTEIRWAVPLGAV
jgi:signal transduction histidine kinase